MPDPRIRRSRRGARQGRSPDHGAPEPAPVEPEVPAVPDAAASETGDQPTMPGEHLEADAAASAEAEAAALAAGDLAAGEAADEPGQDAEPGQDDEPGQDAAADEPAGWFREEPIDDDAASAEVTLVATAGAAAAADGWPGEWPPAADEAAGEQGTAQGTPGAGEEAVDAAGDIDATGPVVRERDRPVVTPLPAPSEPSRRGRLRGFLLGLVTVAAVAAVGFVAGLMLPTILPGPGIGTTPPPSATPSEAPSPTITTAPTASPTAVATATAAPTAPSTAAPPATPVGQVIYVVKRGDQLALIAAAYKVSVAAIQKANNIKDPNLIVVGQKLIIPLPAASPSP